MTTLTHRSIHPRYFAAMLKIAAEMGCQLQPTPTDPALLRGLCPFHEAKSMAYAHTLHIDTRTTRFRCQVCPAHGNPIAFIAKAWGLSAQDAYQLVSHTGDVGFTRPPYQDNHHDPDDPLPALQNTAVLTRATRYYGQQVYHSYPALYFLAQLAVHPDSRRQSRDGLLPRPRAGTIPPRQRRPPHRDHRLPPLPIPGQHRDLRRPHHPLRPRLHRRRPLDDLNHPRPAVRPLRLAPQAPRHPRTSGTPVPSPQPPRRRPPPSQRRRHRRPPAPRPPRRQGRPHRLHPTADKGQPGPPTEQAAKIANALKNRSVRQVTIAIHDPGYRQYLPESLAGVLPTTTVVTRSLQDIMKAIHPHTRDLDGFTGFKNDPPAPRGQPPEEAPTVPEGQPPQPEAPDYPETGQHHAR